MNLSELRKKTNKTQREFAEYLHIPYANIRNWEQGFRTPPDYLPDMIERIMIADGYLVDTSKTYYSRDNKIPFRVVWKNGKYLLSFMYMDQEYDIKSPNYCFAKKDIESYITYAGFYVDDKVDELKFFSKCK